MKKKILISSVLIAGTAMLASCINESETTNELRIEEKCNTDSDLCRFELVNATVLRQTNVLGREVTRTLNKAPLQSIEGVITWAATNGTPADSAVVATELGQGCENDDCTVNANPTAFEFATGGSNAVSLSGNVMVDGKLVDLSLAVKPVTVDTVEEPIATGTLVLTGIPQAIFDNIKTGPGVVVTKGGNNSAGFKCPAGLDLFGLPTGEYPWDSQPPTQTIDIVGYPSGIQNATGNELNPGFGVLGAARDSGINEVFPSPIGMRYSNELIWFNSDDDHLYISCLSNQWTAG